MFVCFSCCYLFSFFGGGGGKRQIFLQSPDWLHNCGDLPASVTQVLKQAYKPSLVGLFATYYIIFFSSFETCLKLYFSALCLNMQKKKIHKYPKLNHIPKFITNSNSLVNYFGFFKIHNHMTNHWWVTVWKGLHWSLRYNHVLITGAFSMWESRH